MIQDLLFILFLFLIVSFISSCSNPGQNIDPNLNYRMDMDITTKEGTQTGMAVLPQKESYRILFESFGKLDLFRFTSCSRDIVLEEARNGLDKKSVVIDYTPNEIEKLPACTIEVGAYSKDKRNSSAYIDIEDKSATVPAVVLCGEKTTVFNGVSVCQNRVGLQQKIKFSEEMKVNYDKNCDKIQGINMSDVAKEFIFELHNGFCLYIFESKDKKLHRLTTYGYEGVMVREQ